MAEPPALISLVDGDGPDRLEAALAQASGARELLVVSSGDVRAPGELPGIHLGALSADLEEAFRRSIAEAFRAKVVIGAEESG
jgi:hypothetical protein